MTESEITQAVADYADLHLVEESAVDVSRNYCDGETVGIRLSLDVDGASKGCDERYGEW